RHDRQPAETGDNLAQEFESLAGGIGRLTRKAGDIPARPRQTCDEAEANRVGCQREDDGYDRCRLLCREDCASRGDNDIDLESDKLGRDFGVALDASLCPAILDRDGAALDPAEFAQPLHKSRGPMAPCSRRAGAEKSDGRQLAGLLRPPGERPKIRRQERRAAEQCDELPPLHSITSSARASSVGGMVRPSVFAVLRLMTSSNLVGCWTGRSDGFAPFMI